MRESFKAENPHKENKQDENVPVDSGRRNFLKGLGAVGAVTFAASTLGRPFLENEGRKLYGESFGSEALEQELCDLRERLRQERGVEIDFSPMSPLERAEELQSEPVESLVEKRDICEAFLQAFALYPRLFHEKTDLSIIRVVNNLKNHENTAKGTEKSDIAGLALPDNGVMYLEYTELLPNIPNADVWVADKLKKISPDSSEEKQEHARSIFHHELAHFVEWADPVDDEQYSRTTRGFWHSEQPPKNYLSTLYSGELEYLLKQNVITKEMMTRLQKNYAGFAHPYGKTDFYEDRATLAEALMTRGGSLSELRGREHTDEVLKKKTAFMKKSYFKKSCGLMGDTYWDLMEQPDVSEKVIANHLTDRARILSAMSDKAFVLYMKDRLEEPISDDKLLEWKKTLREEIGEKK